MKSLEIVNDKIAELKDTYQHYTAVEKDKAKSSFAKFDIEQYQQIKQDLEVLEILKNKNINVGRFKARCYISSDPHQLMRTYNCDCNYIDDELSIDEVIKLKQWLEENA